MEIKHALIIDDELHTRDIISLVLESEGIVTFVAKDGGEALEILNSLGEERDQIDVIVTDFRMPNVDGAAFVKELRKLGSETPVVVVTAHRSEEIRDVEQKDINCKVFYKPLNYQSFSKIIKELII